MTFEFFTSADMLTKVFWLAAICGTLFFSFRVILTVVAGGTADFDGDIDLHAHHGHDVSHSSDIAFEMFSINTITAFVMMFGWVGLTCHEQFQLNSFASTVIAFLAGVFAMIVIAYIFKLAFSLVSKGATFKIDDLVGMNASVYQRIPAQGSGKISVIVPSGGTREVEAMSADKVDIASFQKVKIVAVIDRKTLSVKKI